MTTRHDIPSRGTGPKISTYYVVDLSTDEHWPVSTPDALRDHAIVLVAVPPEVVESSSVAEWIHTDADLANAPSVAEVIEFARRPALVSIERVSPEVQAAIEAGLDAAEQAMTDFHRANHPSRTGSPEQSAANLADHRARAGMPARAPTGDPERPSS